MRWPLMIDLKRPIGLGWHVSCYALAMNSNLRPTALLRLLCTLSLLVLSSLSHASIVYETWYNDEDDIGNYRLTVNQADGRFHYDLTVDPWNAEAFGLFIDLGAMDVANVDFINTTPAAPMALYTTNTPSHECGGGGCRLTGLDLPDRIGNDWELVFRFGDSGFDSLQHFTWSTSDFGLTLANFGLAGLRAQVLCSGSDLLPADSEQCESSDKAWAYPQQAQQVPEPHVLFLLGAALCGLALARRRYF